MLGILRGISLRDDILILFGLFIDRVIITIRAGFICLSRIINKKCFNFCVCLKLLLSLMTLYYVSAQFVENSIK